MNELQQLPSVDEFLRSASASSRLAGCQHSLLLMGARETLQELRDQHQPGGLLPTHDQLIQMLENKISSWITPTLTPVINASGVILHTNLGRAPLSEAALQAIRSASSSYSNLEYDLQKGERGKRTSHVEQLLVRLTGAESALVVNNNAAAVLLVLTALARRKRVIISRTQLIEIGGGFRVPDVMEQSGAKLVSIGTTNRVHLTDYQQALEQSAALVLCAHSSNFRIIGFSSEPELKKIVEVTHAASLPLVYDLGSGAMLDTAQFGLAHEPMVQEALLAGADIVCFSGDKLLGGPQAGIIVGKKELLEKIKRHPLARALRADKVCLAGISATLLHYLKGEALQYVPVWKMIAAPLEELKNRADRWQMALGQGQVIPGQSMVGGGSLPGESLPTFLLALDLKKPGNFLKRLRELPIPIIARVEKDRVVFDPRTVLDGQDETLLAAMHNLP